MSRPTQTEVDTAVENLLDAANCIKKAAGLLDSVPARFRSRVEDIDGTDAIDASLAKAITSLADQIILDAEVSE